MSDEIAYVYGYGKTKHLPASDGSKMWGRPAGLCGAPGGYPRDEPQRPLCKRCERKAVRVDTRTHKEGQNG